jgi:hypothetical protein
MHTCTHYQTACLYIGRISRSHFPA